MLIIKPTTISIQRILNQHYSELPSILRNSLPHIISILVLKQCMVEIRYIVNVS